MFDRPIEEMREEIRGNNREMFWAKYIISKQLIDHYNACDIDRFLEHTWREVDDAAAQAIFEKINDGRLYCLQVKRFKRNFQFADALQGDFRYTTPHYAAMPELSIGYKGTLSLVRIEPHRVPPTWAYRPPTWVEIRDGIRTRLQADFKPNDKDDDETWEAGVRSKLVLLRRWFVKNVLARMFYMPDTNPEFWGVDDF